MKLVMLLLVCLAFTMKVLSFNPNPPLVNHTCSYYKGLGDQLNYPDCDMSIRRTCLNASYVVMDFLELLEANFTYFPLFFENLDWAVANGFKTIEICHVPKLIEGLTIGIGKLLDKPIIFG